MNRWLKVGAAVLFLAWTPFLYSELTSSPQEKKDRDLPEDADPSAEAVAVAPADEADEDEEPDPAAEPEEAPAKPAAAAEPAEPGVEPESAQALAEPETEGDEQPDAPAPTASGPIGQLKHAFDSEPRDALWAKDTEAKVASVMSGGDMPDTLFSRAACRKTVCRVDVQWSQENAAPYLDVHEELSQLFGSDIGVEPGAVDGETLPIHLYLIRKGYTLADVTK